MVREHWAIPAIGLVAILVIGGARFQESRIVLAQLVALGAPLATMVVAAAPLREAHPTLRAIAFTLAGLLAIAAELRVLPVMLPGALSPQLVPLVTAAATAEFLPVVAALAVSTVPLEAVAAKRGVGSRFAALAGINVGLSLYLPAHVTTKDPLGSVLVAFLVALFAGGGVGLLFGTLARVATGSRA